MTVLITMLPVANEVPVVIAGKDLVIFIIESNLYPIHEEIELPDFVKRSYVAGAEIHVRNEVHNTTGRICI